MPRNESSSCTSALDIDPFSTAMGTRQDRSQKNPPKCCRKQQPSCMLPPRPTIHSRAKALKIDSSLTHPFTPAQRLSNTRTPTPQMLSGLCQGLACIREWTTPHPTAQPAPSHFLFSLLLPQLLPCPPLPLPALPLTRTRHTT